MRLVILFLLVSCGSAFADLDQYGGDTALSCSNATGHFTMVKIASRWWFCTPDQHVMYANAIANVVSGGAVDCYGNSYTPTVTAKYGDATFNWAYQEEKRIKSWGYNAIGQDSGAQVLGDATCNYPNSPACIAWPGVNPRPNPVPLPYFSENKPSANAMQGVNGYISEPIKDLIKGADAHFKEFRGAAVPDFFDTKMHTWWAASLASATNLNYRNNDPWILGIFTDDSDFTWGSGAGPDFPAGGHNNTNPGFMALITSPVQTYVQATAQSGLAFVYADTKLHAKADALDPVAACSISAPCSLRDYLKKKYTTIGALNTAWGSNYTAFDSSGTQVTGEALGTGDGSTVYFTATLAHNPISPNSVSVLLNGNAFGGDCPNFIPGCAAQTPNGTISGYSAPFPTIPVASKVAGSGAGGTVVARIAWVSSGVVGPRSAASNSVTLSASDNLKVNAPTATNGPVPPDATGWNVYVGAAGAETQQNSSPIALNSSWTEPNGGLITGTATEKLQGIPLPWAVASISESANTVTVTLTRSVLPGGFATGRSVFMGGYSGTVPAYNGVFTIASTGTNSFTFTHATSGLATLNNVGTATVSGINYTTGVISVAFSTPPGNAVPITVSYVYSGWNAGGTGLMDESGNNTAWVGTNGLCLEGSDANYPTYFSCTGATGYNPVPNANATLGADLDAWVSQYSARFHKTMSDDLKAVSGIPYFGIDMVGSYGTPAYSKFLAGAAPYVDGVLASLHSYQPINVASPTGFVSAYNYMTRYLGDLPFVVGNIPSNSQTDSPMSCYANDNPNDQGTAAGRGQSVYTTVNYLLNNIGFNSTYQNVGYSQWAWNDFAKINQGIVTTRDNAYDGVQACAATSTDIFGYARGGETVPGPRLQNHAYTTGFTIWQNVGGEIYQYKAKIPGTTANSAGPTFPITLAATVVDGTMTWENAGDHGPLGSETCYTDEITPIRNANAIWNSIASAGASLAVSTSSLPGGAIGVAYSQPLAAVGGTLPYTWSIFSPTLPAGITLSGSTLSGTPTTAGTSNFTVRVTDGVSATANQALSIVVAATPIPNVTNTSLPNGVIGSSYSQLLSATGGTSPYTWSIFSGTLPAGLSLTGATISGTPSAADVNPFVVRVTDSVNATDNQALSITIVGRNASITGKGSMTGQNTLQ